MPLDDTWIHFRFADNFSIGYFFQYNKGEPTAGTTSPLWVILLSVFGLFSKNYIFGSVFLSLLFNFGSVVLVYLITNRVFTYTDFGMSHNMFRSWGFGTRGKSEGFGTRGKSEGFGTRGKSEGFGTRGKSEGFGTRGKSESFGINEICSEVTDKSGCKKRTGASEQGEKTKNLLPFNPGFLAAVLTAVNGRFLWSGISGMETTMFAFFCLAGVYAYIKNISENRGSVIPALLFGFATVSRPEGLLLFGVYLIDVIVRYGFPLKTCGNDIRTEACGNDKRPFPKGTLGTSVNESEKHSEAGASERVEIGASERVEKSEKHSEAGASERVEIGASERVETSHRQVVMQKTHRGFGTGINSIMSLIVFILIASPYFIFSYIVSGNFLPNTFRGQSGSLNIIPNTEYLRIIFTHFLRDNLIITLIYLFSVLFYIFNLRKFFNEFRYINIIFLWIILLPLISSITVPNWRHHGRYMIPLIPFINIASVFMLSRIYKIKQIKENELLRKLVVYVIICFSIPYFIVYFYAAGKNTANINDMQVRTGYWIKENIKDGSTVAMNDIGAITFISDVKVFDMVGLVSPEIFELKKINYENSMDSLFYLLKKKNVNYIVIFDHWYKDFMKKFGHKFEKVFSAPLRENTICGGFELTVYKIDYNK